MTGINAPAAATLLTVAQRAIKSTATAREWLRRSIGRAYRGARRRVDRTLHPWRRHRSLQRVARLRNVRRILVVCHGNVCRSPFAAALLRDALPVTVTSAGFLPSGRAVPSQALEVAAKHMIDLSGHRSQLVTRELLESVDLALVMDAPQARALRRIHRVTTCEIMLLGDLDPQPADTRAIVDPWARPVDVFNEAYMRIDRCCCVLARTLVG